jgi:hypothetical protein
MFSLMLDPRCKTFLVPSLIDQYQIIFLFPMLLKCHYHLHVFVEFERGVVDQRVEKENNLDIFEMIASTSEHATKLINRELLIFRHYQVDVKNIKCLLQWWEKYESMFPTIGFYARQISKVVGSQIETDFFI